MSEEVSVRNLVSKGCTLFNIKKSKYTVTILLCKYFYTFRKFLILQRQSKVNSLSSKKKPYRIETFNNSFDDLLNKITVLKDFYRVLFYLF